MTPDQRWNAVLAQDPAFDGQFLYGVLTTGVYCRPSCPARRPLRANVRFYDSASAAEADGLRPCHRCRPTIDTNARIRAACAHIDAHPDQPLRLADLAHLVGLSRFYFSRAFKAVVGVGPRDYAEARRVERLKASLRSADSVTDAVYDSGFGSSSRVYERADTRLGMTPREYRRGGAGTSITYAAATTAFGMLMIGATDRGICFLQFGDSTDSLATELRREYPNAEIAEARVDARLEAWMESIRAHLAGSSPRPDLPLDIRATAFQMKVWKHLQSIPRGSVKSYTEVARHIGRPTAARAVAVACASNPVAVLIPCHRVVRGTGDLGGYRWGVERKRALIDAERAR
jgi:AraC family transcriptional regulator of adaptative response/methylated-DNA-[protein]-cysteine methyltransferase